jgi:hypothetical protein
VIWAGRWNTIEELEAAVRSFVELHTHEWLIERHGHPTPGEPHLTAMGAVAVNEQGQRRVRGTGIGSPHHWVPLEISPDWCQPVTEATISRATDTFSL